MTVACQVDCVSPAAWRELSSRFADHSIYQTWAFGEISAADTRSVVSRAVFRRGESVIGAAQLRIKRLPFLSAGLAYVYFGPLWRRDDATLDDLRDVLHSLQMEYGVRRRLEVRVVPNLPTDDDVDTASVWSRSGFHRDASRGAYRTSIVDLAPSPDELRKQLAQKWRNGLNQGERRGVRVESSRDAAAMERFEALYDAMRSRKRFETGVSVSSFRRLQDMLADGEKMTILLAFVGDQLVAGHVSSTLGDTCLYLLGASNELGRESKASYILQWQAMMAARDAGARRYDLGGIDPEANPGVHHFKSGLGGVERTFVGQYVAKGRGASRILVPLAERAYRALRPTRRAAQA